MKLSTKGRYGLRALVDMAVYSKGEHVSLSSIAERQNISMNYLEQVFSILKKSGLVKSVKGAQGGYILAQNPKEIKVGTVLRTLEGSLSVIDENSENSNTDQTTIQHCIKINVWDRINEAIDEFVDSMSIEDIAENYRKIKGIEDGMYYI